MDTAACPFCERIKRGDVTAANELAVAFPDAFPISPGHTLIIPRRHEPDFFSLSEEEELAVWHLVRKERTRLNEQHSPQAYNVGINAGQAAGQTVEHAHVHLIPRFTGDVEDARGGVRWLISSKARYWS
jgi:diadenosine tetraphosphate (Ap4A) HIT family hydrolase